MKAFVILGCFEPRCEVTETVATSAFARMDGRVDVGPVKPSGERLRTEGDRIYCSDHCRAGRSRRQSLAGSKR